MHVDHRIFEGLGLPENILATVDPVRFDAFLKAKGWLFPTIVKAESLVRRAKEEASGWFSRKDWKAVYVQLLQQAGITPFTASDLQSFMATARNNPRRSPFKLGRYRNNPCVVWAGTGTPVPGTVSRTTKEAQAHLTRMRLEDWDGKAATLDYAGGPGQPSVFFPDRQAAQDFVNAATIGGTTRNKRRFSIDTRPVPPSPFASHPVRVTELPS